MLRILSVVPSLEADVDSDFLIIPRIDTGLFRGAPTISESCNWPFASAFGAQTTWISFFRSGLKSFWKTSDLDTFFRGPIYPWMTISLPTSRSWDRLFQSCVGAGNATGIDVNGTITTAEVGTYRFCGIRGMKLELFSDHLLSEPIC